MFEAFINTIRSSVPDTVNVEGCTEQELDQLRQSQQVACLPEAYAALMRLMGQCGVEWLFVCGESDCNDCLTHKETLIKDQGGSQRFTYPEDMFVFFHDPQGYEFYIFRTKDCIPDPPVYIVGVNCYYLYANTFTELVLDYLVYDADGLPMKTGDRMKAAWEQEYIFDPAIDDFRPRISPYTQPLTIEQILSFMHERWIIPLEGCTPEEIDELRCAQRVSCLPRTYRLLMASCGKYHMPAPVTEWEYARRLKKRLRKHLAENKPLLSKPRSILSNTFDNFAASRGVLDPIGNKHILPSDLFLFDYGSYNYYAFRTRDCLDDPEVIEIVVKIKKDGNDLVIRRYEPFSEFLRLEMDPNHSHRIQRQRQKWELPLFTYDAALDDFVPLPPAT